MSDDHGFGMPAPPLTEAEEAPEKHLDRLVNTLLYEGYALYPYTPGATKNATPTPFGIVYPADYAERQTHAFDRMQMEGVITDAEAPVTGQILFLQASGERHKAEKREVLLNDGPAQVPFEFEGVQGRATLAVQRLPSGAGRVTLRVENTTPLTEAQATADRKEVLPRSLLSTHLIARVSGASFLSPLERGDDGVAGCTNVNTWPVLATPEDDAILGPTIMLPEHPQIAPESVNDFFDGTEIEEALVLHIQALSDQEREEIAAQDPKVREMLERADATTPEQLMDMHGRVRLNDPPGEKTAPVGEHILKRGDKLILRPPPDADVYDKMLEGRTATIGRFYYDDQNRLHIGVTVDDDPMSEIFSDSGRFLFFFEHEVEVPQ